MSAFALNSYPTSPNQKNKIHEEDEFLFMFEEDNCNDSYAKCVQNYANENEKLQLLVNHGGPKRKNTTRHSEIDQDKACPRTCKGSLRLLSDQEFLCEDICSIEDIDRSKRVIEKKQEEYHKWRCWFLDWKNREIVQNEDKTTIEREETLEKITTNLMH